MHDNQPLFRAFEKWVNQENSFQEYDRINHNKHSGKRGQHDEGEIEKLSEGSLKFDTFLGKTEIAESP